MWRPYGCHHNYYTGSALNQCFVRARSLHPPGTTLRPPGAGGVMRCLGVRRHKRSAQIRATRFAPAASQTKLQRVKFIGESTLGEVGAMHGRTPSIATLAAYNTQRC